MNSGQIADRLLDTLRAACDGTELPYREVSKVLADLQAEYDLLAEEEDVDTTYLAQEGAMLRADDR